MGMDCLHGVLMHGDEEQGESHKSEDTYIRLEKEDAARLQRKHVGPCQGEDCMELIAHGGEDPDKAHKMSQKVGPERNGEPSTVDMDSVLHGGKHVDHSAPRKSEERNGNQEQVIVDVEAILHGGEHVDHSAPRKVVEIESNEEPSTVDMDALLHGGEHVDHSAPRKKEEVQGDQDPSTVDAEMLLHGGEHVDHSAPRKEKESQSGEAPSTIDMDMVLHGGEHVDHSQEAKKDVKKDSPPPIVDMEGMLHGSENGHNIHAKKNKRVGRKGALAGTVDPHALIHGEHKISTGAMDSEELKDYEDWRKTKDVQDATDDDAYSVMGFSFPFISDSILSEIDMLKRRYLPKFWGKSDDDEEIGEEILPLDDGRFDDVTSGVSVDLTIQDMRHELENIGNTETKTSQHLEREESSDSTSRKGKRKRKQEI